MDPAEAEKQVALLKQTFPYMRLVKAASVGQGITRLTESK
jgi:hypothetical protein